MTKAELYNLMGNPNLLESKHIAPLEQLLEAYPYVSSFVYLYLYTLAKTEDVRYHSELKRLSAYLPNREALYRLVSGRTNNLLNKKSESPKTQGSFCLIDNFLADASMAGEDLPEELHFNKAVQEDYFASEMRDESKSESEDDLQIITPIANRQSDATKETVNEEQELFTETLAKIYIQQEKYERALAIIENLYLHYPEKNRYFVAQIRFLKRLIENNKLKQE